VHVPEQVFAQKRRQILEDFLRRPVLFVSPAFNAHLERQARRNLAEALRRLT
jgi:predicted metal-dependent HD superfamily phosphohydrolase